MESAAGGPSNARRPAVVIEASKELGHVALVDRLDPWELLGIPRVERRG